MENELPPILVTSDVLIAVTKDGTIINNVDIESEDVSDIVTMTASLFKALREFIGELEEDKFIGYSVMLQLEMMMLDERLRGRVDPIIDRIKKNKKESEDD